MVSDGKGDDMVALVGVAGLERENCLSRMSRTMLYDCD